jgi:beta-aspartyl-peptidase (threonine type)
VLKDISTRTLTPPRFINPLYYIHKTCAAAEASTMPAAGEQLWALAIHGGAGVINSTNTEWLDDAKRGLEASLRAGEAVLASGASAIDAVVAAVESMENEPHFNAGESMLCRCMGQNHSPIVALWMQICSRS